MPVRTRSKNTVRVLTVAAAIVVALIIWLIAVPVAGVDLAARTGQGTQDIGAAQVVVVTALASLAGWGLLGILERRADNPVRVWTLVASAVLVLSLVGPLGADTLGAGLTLAALHLATAAVLIVGMHRSAAAQPLS